MNKFVAVFTLALAIGGSAFAESQPEIAYRLLSGYVGAKEVKGQGGNRVAGSIMTTTGGLLVAGAAATWFAGDDISRSFTGQPMDGDLKVNLSLGLGIGGLVLSGIGSAVYFAKPVDYRSAYGEVFSERDPSVREALSVAVLRDLAIHGKETRIRGAMSSLLVPLISAAIRAGVNLSEGRIWYDKIGSSISASSWSIVGGITTFFSTSEEERLYEKYLAGRDALYGEREGK
jgi:hypothetical protein